MNIIIDYNRTIFDPETNTLFSGVLELLQRLSKNYPLFLVSRNEPGREEQFRSFNIQQYFERVVFVDEKNTQLFQELGTGSNQVIVIGDSIRDEISIGNSLGFITVRVKQGKFANEVSGSEKEVPTHAISAIQDLENIISLYEK